MDFVNNIRNLAMKIVLAALVVLTVLVLVVF